MKDLGDVGQDIMQEYEAIALALDAIGYMVRKTKDVAFILHVSQVAKPQQPAVHEIITNQVISGCRATLRDTRIRLGEILERVGNDRNHNDAVTDAEAQLTAPAFEAMRKRAGVGGQETEP